MTPIDSGAVEIEEALWMPTPQLRWYRPPRGLDHDAILEQLWERVTGERQWRAVPIVHAD